MYFPPGVNSWTIFLSKLLPNLLGLVRRMANFRVSGGLRGHRSGISSITHALWLGGGGSLPSAKGPDNDKSLPPQGAVWVSYLLSPFHIPPPNCFSVTQTIRPVSPCEASKDKSNPSFHGRQSNMLKQVVGPPLSLLFFRLNSPSFLKWPVCHGTVRLFPIQAASLDMPLLEECPTGRQGVPRQE